LCCVELLFTAIFIDEGNFKKFHPFIDEKTPEKNTEVWRNYVVSEREKCIDRWPLDDPLLITLYVPPSASAENVQYYTSSLQNFMLFG
jgi:hypothetical protein